ncbi:hypothetical protein [Tautonia rosea]|uniref:hypothetical protein n=1 Tax=Tautonia rosea TaxID=2728037 RepID=UPI001473C0FE|nr:hypothetical protein [Tautonia rosea]
MHQRELIEWLANVLKNLVVAIIQGDRSAVGFVLISVPVILIGLWACSRHRHWFAGMRRGVSLQVEEAPQEQWSPPSPEEVARIVGGKPLVTSRGEVPRASPHVEANPARRDGFE